MKIRIHEELMSRTGIAEQGGTLMHEHYVSAGRSIRHTEAVDLQVAIFDTVARAKGLSVLEARDIFAAVVSSIDVTPPSGLWVDAAITSATLGQPYIISAEARQGAEILLQERREDDGAGTAGTTGSRPIDAWQ